MEALFEPPSSAKEPELPFVLDRNRREAWDFEMRLEGLGDYEAITRIRPAVEYISRKRKHLAYGPWQKPKLLQDGRIQ
ncbi:hypothetical protein GCM10010523_35320 [Paenarthrobacter ilicis]